MRHQYPVRKLDKGVEKSDLCVFKLRNGFPAVPVLLSDAKNDGIQKALNGTHAYCARAARAIKIAEKKDEEVANCEWSAVNYYV